MNVAVLVFVAVLLPGTVAALSCEETDQRYAMHLAGEVAGDRSYTETVGPGWVFTLERQPLGWAIRLNARDGKDLSQVTPPFHGPNPRDLVGWHFRNVDNTGPNDGSVNAPQRDRLFLFAPQIEGTAGFKAPKDAAAVDADGRGWLRIDDFGLADLAAGEQARMVYLKFFACLTWPKPQEAIRAEAEATSTAYLPEEVEIFGSCGLGATDELKAYIVPRFLAGDLDGDGSLDHAAPVVRKRDGKRGLAICRAGTDLTLIGFDQPLDALPPGYFEQLEAWSIRPRHELTEYEGSTPLPMFNRDVIVLERIEKSSYTVYWDDGKFRGRRDFCADRHKTRTGARPMPR